jgi:mannose-6-phosphate isomerase
MATSDNVVRAGLTPKLRDVDTLVEMLTYEAGPASQQLLRPTPFSESEDKDKDLLYDPPIDEFSVIKVALEKDGKTKHRAVEGPSICVVTKGDGKVTWGDSDDGEEVKKGDVVFIGAGEEIEWAAGEGLEVFRAFVEVK